MTRGGLSRDQRAAVRRLSLVAALIGGGKTIYETHRFKSEDHVRQSVEEYEDAFRKSSRNGGDARRATDALRKTLGRDIEALSRVGIHVETRGDREGRGYRLKPGDYPPERIELEEEERAVLVGALRALRDDFPYSRPLGLALSNLIRDAGGGATEAGFEPSVDAADPDAAVFGRLSKLDAAVARRKRVRFRYYAIGRDESSERELEPYALSLISGSWYVTGRDATRKAVREFRLDRMEGNVAYADPDREDQFEVPPDFRTGPRAPWQLGPTVDEARVLFAAPEEAELAIRTYPGALTKVDEDARGAVLLTSYSGERQLAGWLLSVGARVLSPSPLIGAMRTALERLVGAHEGPGTPAGAASPKGSASRPGKVPRKAGVSPEPLALEFALARYVAFLPKDSDVPLREIAGELGCTVAELEKASESVKWVSDADRSYINVEVGGGRLVKFVSGFDRDFRRSLWLSPVQVRAALLALDLVAGAADPAILDDLRRKVRAVVRKHGAVDELDEVATQTLTEGDEEIAAAVERARKENRVLEIRYPSGPDDEVRARAVEPMLVTNVRGKRYLNAYCRLAEDARLFRLDRVLHARVLDERFVPREDFTLREGFADLDPRLYAAGRAVIRFSPEVARWMKTHHELDLIEEDGDRSALYALFYKDTDWAAGRVMQYRGEAVVLEPEELREKVRARAEELLRAYREGEG